MNMDTCHHCKTATDLTEFGDILFCKDCITDLGIGRCYDCDNPVDMDAEYFELGVHVDNEYDDKILVCEYCSDNHIENCYWCSATIPKHSYENLIVEPVCDDEHVWCCDECKMRDDLWGYDDDTEVICHECDEHHMVKDSHQNIGGTFTCNSCLNK